MNASLFARIIGVADYSKKGKGGFLLLLDIDGRPMTCFTFEGENLSEEVRHKILLFY